MAWTHITARSLPSTPWKNGGGTTREVLKVPAEATLDTFDWRISLAAVATSGPFSIFPGIDRTMIVTDGKGIELDDKTTRVALGPSDAPFSFAGEVPYQGTLLDGPIADLNVMTRRARYSHSLHRFRTGGTSVDKDGVRIIVALQQSRCLIGSERLALGKLDSVLIEGPESAVVASSDWLEIEIARRL